jgi:osmotically-inducible protein OsmY
MSLEVPSAHLWKNGGGGSEKLASGPAFERQERQAAMMQEAKSNSPVEDVMRAFRADPRLGPYFSLGRIAVEADGTLALEGEVSSLAEKKLALLLAARSMGTARIADRIHVRPAMPVGDREMRARLREVLAGDSDFADLELREDVAAGILAAKFEPVAGPPEPRGRIDIEVEGGVIILNGSVPTLVRKRLAGALAWRIAGVRDVVNGLVVEPPEEDGPDRLEEAVRVVLERDSAFDASQIKVGVRVRVVRLTGLLPSEKARQAAVNDAWTVFGVDEVLDEIDIRP